MSIASAVVEIRDGSGESVLARLANISQVSVYGIRDNRIVAVIEGGSLAVVNDVVKALALLDEVIGVYPVYLAGDDPPG